MESIRELYKIGKGPSSSHTIGPERAAKYFLKKYPDAEKYQVKLYGSLSKTGIGHGTDRVLYEVFGQNVVEVIFCDKDPEDMKHPNTMDFIAKFKDSDDISLRVISIGGGDIVFENAEFERPPEIYPENTFAEVEQFCRFRGFDLAEYVEFREKDGIRDYLGKVWNVMKSSIDEGLKAEGILPGGLNVQKKAKMLIEHKSENENPQVRESRILSAFAYAVNEQNADCGTIVTAPTCGACGVVPAVLRYFQLEENLTDDQIISSLEVAGLFGNLVKKNASISGAECGCQAEVGTACSMAAAALSYLKGHETNRIQYAAEIALEHHLGLTCDPICGLVQIPCIERNAVATMRAVNACNLAYLLNDTQRISFDIVVKTMYETGVSMNDRFRETSEGGLARIWAV